jgi:hypothetical protein
MYEYGVVIRRARRGESPVWQFWVGSGCLKEDPAFLAVMNFAGEQGFEAFAAGSFDEVGVPEVLMKRALGRPAAAGAAAGGAADKPAKALAVKAAAKKDGKPAKKGRAAAEN